jgi:hypothetical protein
MAQVVLAMGAVIALRDAERRLEDSIARQSKSQAEAYTADYPSQDQHSLLSGARIRDDGLNQPVR